MHEQNGQGGKCGKLTELILISYDLLLYKSFCTISCYQNCWSAMIVENMLL